MKTTKDTNERKQKQYRAVQKVAIIREHLLEKKPVSDICDKYGIHPSVYYRWQKQFFEGGDKAFAAPKQDKVFSQLKQEVNWLESKLTRKDEVIGELMEEYVTLKKSVGGR